MWHANIARRQVLEALLTGAVPKAVEVHDISGVATGGANPFDVFWLVEPNGSVGDLPVLMVVDDSDLQEVMAMLGSAPQVPSPFTAFCRIVSRSEVSYLEKSPDRVRPEVIRGLAGLALAEAAIYSGGAVRVSDISPAACKRTLSFVYGRALAQLPVDALPAVVRRWLDTQNLLGVSAAGFDQVTKSLLPLLDVSARALWGLAPDEALSAVISEIIEFGEPSESGWNELSNQHIRLPSLRVLAEGTREERSVAFQDVLRALYARPSGAITDEAVASCALAGTRISPGTFDHLGLLAGHPDARLPLWYGFFAAIQRGGSALRSNAGFGLRVMRDMDRARSFDSAPTADISSEELAWVFKMNLGQLGKRLSHSNEIVVELFPGLDASFRYGSRVERKDLPQQTDVASPAREQSLNEKIETARKLLAEISRQLDSVVTKSGGAKPARKRPSKSDRLF